MDNTVHGTDAVGPGDVLARLDFELAAGVVAESAGCFTPPSDEATGLGLIHKDALMHARCRGFV